MSSELTTGNRLGFVPCGTFLFNMKLTWTFYPKGQTSITLTVFYLPKLDGLSDAGYLEIGTNTAYVNWSAFRIFDSGYQPSKKALFESLTRVDHFNPVTAAK